jgi:hypothetical protein
MASLLRLSRNTSSLPVLLSQYCLRSLSTQGGGSAGASEGGKSGKEAIEKLKPLQKKPEVLKSAEDLEGAQRAEDAARFATAFMFPWEKRALDGSAGKSPMAGLSNVEKGYWLVFSGAMLYFGLKLFNNKTKTEEVTEEEQEEARTLEQSKKERALSILQGESIIGGTEDPFEGLSPSEIDAYVKENTKHKLTPALMHKLPKLMEEEDEFDGMTPDEINDLLAKRAKA